MKTLRLPQLALLLVPMAEPCVILFVDLAGSVNLYDRLGDELAKSLVLDLQRLLTTRVEQFQGHVQEVIGDELMARFDEPDAALGCSITLHRCAESYSQQHGQKLQLRIGLHYGPVIVDREENRLFGDTINLASRVTDIAQAGQTITTDKLVLRASSAWQESVRRFDITPVKGQKKSVVVYDLPWQHDDLTAIVAAEATDRSSKTVPSLTLGYRDTQARLTEHDGAFSIGRAMTNDLIVNADPVSRRHVSIERIRDHYILTDQSTNGTHLYFNNGETLYLRRQQSPLWGAGKIALGAPQEHGDEHVVQFNCGQASPVNYTTN